MPEQNEIITRARRLLAVNRDRKIRMVVEDLVRYVGLLEDKIIELEFDMAEARKIHGD